MKQFCLFSVLLVVFGLSLVHAQNEVNLGVIGGLNISDAKIEGADGDEMKTSSQNQFGVGILAELVLTENVSLGTNILYLKKSVTVETDDPQSFDVWAGYIEVPLYIKASFGTEIRPYILAGPSLGLLLNSEITTEFGGIDFTGDFIDVLKNSEFSIVFGVGVEVPVWQGLAFIQARYAYGIQDILKGGTVQLRAGETLQLPATINAGDNLYTRNFLILAGYSIHL